MRWARKSLLPACGPSAPSAVSRTISLSGRPNACARPTSLSTSRSQPLRASLARPSSSSDVSAVGRLRGEPDQHLTRVGAVPAPARPARRWSAPDRRAGRRRPSFLILVLAAVRRGEVGRRRGHHDQVGVRGRRSAIAVGQVGGRGDRCDRRRRAGPAGSRSPRPGATSAPRSTAARARAQPIRPEERLPRNRTGSRCSRVPPALTATRRPARSRPAARGHDRRIGRARRSRPRPARRGRAAGRDRSRGRSAGRSRDRRPRAPRHAAWPTLAWVAGCSHISVCIAGAKTTGQWAVSRTLVSRSSARPVAARASRSAVAGATSDQVGLLTEPHVRHLVRVVEHRRVHRLARTAPPRWRRRRTPAPPRWARR